MMLEFTDLSTLDERIGKNEYISTEYKGKTVGWCRAIFIEVDRDENGKLKHVMQIKKHMLMGLRELKMLMHIKNT